MGISGYNSRKPDKLRSFLTEVEAVSLRSSGMLTPKPIAHCHDDNETLLYLQVAPEVRHYRLLQE